MQQRKYTQEEKISLMTSFLKQRRESGISLRTFAGKNGIPYYTMRDLYRDPRYNPEWERRYEYSTQDMAIRNRNISHAATASEPAVFVRIG